MDTCNYLTSLRRQHFNICCHIRNILLKQSLKKARKEYNESNFKTIIKVHMMEIILFPQHGLNGSFFVQQTFDNFNNRQFLTTFEYPFAAASF